MTRTMTLLGLTLLAAGILNIVGCSKPTVPKTHPTPAILALEQDAFDRVNAERTAAGLSALVMDEDLRAVARAHSEDMVARGFFAHVNPDGRNPFQRMGAAGLKYVSAGENIAMNNFANAAQKAVEGWMASPPHRANILHTQFNHTGMGIAVSSTGVYYFTQDFIGTEAKSGEKPVFDYSEPLAITK